MKTKLIFTAACISAISTIAQANNSSSRENLIYPLAQLSDIDWPLLKMTYGYELSGYISGVMVKDDTSYSYSKKSGFKEP